VQRASSSPSESRIAVRRMPTASAPETRYDLVDRRGALDGQLALKQNERVLGFGGRSVYVVATDDDGVERLRRHPWP